MSKAKDLCIYVYVGPWSKPRTSIYRRICRPMGKAKDLGIHICRPMGKAKDFYIRICRPMVKAKDFIRICRPMGKAKDFIRIVAHGKSQGLLYTYM